MKPPGTKFVLLIIISIVTLVLVIFFFFNKNRSNTQENVYQVTETEDFKALGFSGQIKFVSNSENNFYLGYRKKYQGEYEIFVSQLKAEGNSLGVTHTSEPISSVSNGLNQRVPSLAVDSNNFLHTVWYGSDSLVNEDERQIKYSRSIDGGETWSKWLNLSVVSGFDDQDLWQEHPVVATVFNNRVFVVWEGKDSQHDHQQIKFSHSEDTGTTWSTWININPDKESSHSRPAILVDREGTIHVLAYTNKFGDNQKIVHSTSEDFGINWSSWERISNLDSDNRHVSAGINNDGKIMAVWRSFSNGKAQLFYSMFNGNNWQDPKPITNSRDNQFFPSVGTDKDGNFFVAWFEANQDFDLPNEDPESGQIFVTLFETANNTFAKKKQIRVGNEALYPQVLNASPQSKATFVAFIHDKDNPKISVLKTSF